MNKDKKDDRILGCIFGGAIGDAFGGPYEGNTSPVRIDENVTWRLSDDTQLTLATCEAIARAKKVDPAAIAERFAEWFQAGRVSGMGTSTYKALGELVQGGHWALVGRKGEMAAGNGAAMRIAPLAFLLDPSDTIDRRTIRDVCRITHHNDEAYAGALVILTAVRKAWDGTWSGGRDLIRHVVEFLPDCRVRDRLYEISHIDAAVPLIDVAARFGNSGYVVESVPLAICGAVRVQSLGFQALLEQLVSCGGDTDTIASMVGHISGTWVGYKGLPKSMLSQLPDVDMIENITKKFCPVARSRCEKSRIRLLKR